MSVDLHLHTCVSDGIAAPQELVRRARDAGITVLAIADHDDTGGIAVAEEKAKELGVRFVRAIELTARVRPGPEGTVHILGYGIVAGNEALEKAARANRLAKRTQVEAMLDRLASCGIKLSKEEIGLTPGEDRYIGRNQIASALVRLGHAKDRLRAFKKFLAPGGRAFAPVEVVPAAEAVAAIKAAGGLAVLAHPTDDDLDRHLGPLVALGIDGLELYRPRAQGSLLERIERERERHGLLATGGSDWHGLYPEIALGDWRVREESVKAFLERV